MTQDRDARRCGGGTDHGRGVDDRQDVYVHGQGDERAWCRPGVGAVAGGDRGFARGTDEREGGVGFDDDGDGFVDGDVHDRREQRQRDHEPDRDVRVEQRWCDEDRDARGAAAAPITVPATTTGKTYTCTVKATNARGAGLASAPSLPVIVGSPAAPTDVEAKSGATTTATGPLTVTFTIGANNGSAITSQTATCVSSNGGVTKTGTHAGAAAAPITVAGVTTGKTYTCTVKATNASRCRPRVRTVACR